VYFVVGEFVERVEGYNVTDGDAQAKAKNAEKCENGLSFQII
jgi:hypothetical protein